MIENDMQNTLTFNEMNNILQDYPLLNNSLIDRSSTSPDLSEIINFLRHHNDSIKANAAAYLQHLSYMDDNVKVQIRVLRGIPVLVELINNVSTDVQRTACGALRNLSYGRANDENKKEIKDSQGILNLVRLLKRTSDSDIEELVTGVIWNLSSCTELKKSIISECLKALVDKIIIPYSGWKNDIKANINNQNYKSPSYRNASGTLRNISSDGDYARKEMRNCEGLIESLMNVLKVCDQLQDFDGKSLENTVCTLRNLSYACQEIVDDLYLARKNNLIHEKKSQSGCFKIGRSANNSKINQRKENMVHELKEKGVAHLWTGDAVTLYLSILKDCTNPETTEAAIGAIQNLTACDWQPSIDIRTAVRLSKSGLQILIELLSENSDRVVCSAATALRNLSIDDKNKELIGKYATGPLTDKLPSPSWSKDVPLSNNSVAAIQSTLYEVIRSNVSFARMFIEKGGAEKMIMIVHSPTNMYNTRINNYAQNILQKLWKYDELQDELRSRGINSTDLLLQNKSKSSSANNTISRLLPEKQNTNSLSENSQIEKYSNRDGNNQSNYNTDERLILQKDKYAFQNEHSYDPYIKNNSSRTDRPSHLKNEQPYVPFHSASHENIMQQLYHDNLNGNGGYSSQNQNLANEDNSWV